MKDLEVIVTRIKDDLKWKKDLLTEKHRLQTSLVTFCGELEREIAILESMLDCYERECE